MKKLSLLTLFAAAAWAQLEGPTSGYVFSRDGRELRPIRGMAGAAYLGAAVVKDADLAAASADGLFAAVARQGRIELIRNFDGAGATRVTLAEDAAVTAFAWSGRSLAAIGAGRALLWKDVANPQLETIDLAGIDARLAFLDGANLIVAGDGALWLAKAGAAAQRLASLSQAAAIAAANGDLYVADAGANLVLHVAGYAGVEAAARTFAAVAEPVGLQLNKRQLIVASRHSRSLEIFDLASGARTGAVELDFVPSRLERTGARSLSLLNEPSAEEPLFVLDSRDALNTYFIPAGGEQ